MKKIALGWLFIVVASSVSARAADVSVLDGDTLKVGSFTYRLHGIDAPEKAQTCLRDGVEWLCGQEAAAYLRSLVAGQQVSCQTVAKDIYGRRVAVCEAGGLDLGREIVRAGLAWAYVYYSRDYEDSESEARIAGRGIWSSEAVPAWEWRLARRRK